VNTNNPIIIHLWMGDIVKIACKDALGRNVVVYNMDHENPELNEMLKPVVAIPVPGMLADYMPSCDASITVWPIDKPDTDVQEHAVSIVREMHTGISNPDITVEPPLPS
jgi:hypothetical protein